jgi:biotin synthase
MENAMNLNGLADRIIEGAVITPGEAHAWWLADFSAVMYAAARVREAFKGNAVNLCSIVNAKSGACSENCRFCAQSAHHTTAVREYDLLAEDTLVTAALQARDAGARCFGIVTSGRAVSSDEVDVLCRVIAQLRGCGMRISASLGEADCATLEKLKAAGLARFHHNLETAESFFPAICSTHTYADRLRTAAAAKAAGLELCCGGLLGLGETRTQRIEFFCALRDLAPDSVPLNFLTPVPGTPLENAAQLPVLEILRSIAICRLLLPRTDISVCGGREVNLRDAQALIFQAGANGMMTGGYLTTAGRSAAEDRRMIEDLGLRVSSL